MYGGYYLGVACFEMCETMEMKVTTANPVVLGVEGLALEQLRRVMDGKVSDLANNKSNGPIGEYMSSSPVDSSTATAACWFLAERSPAPICRVEISQARQVLKKIHPSLGLDQA